MSQKTKSARSRLYEASPKAAEVIGKALTESRYIFNKEQLENGIVRYSGDVSGFDGEYDSFHFRIDVHDFGVCGYCKLPFVVKKTHRNRVAELLVRINDAVRAGCFDMHVDSGVVRFVVSIPDVFVSNLDKIDSSGIAMMLIRLPIQMIRDWAHLIEDISVHGGQVEEKFKNTLKKYISRR